MCIVRATALRFLDPAKNPAKNPVTRFNRVGCQFEPFFAGKGFSPREKKLLGIKRFVHFLFEQN